MFKKVVLLREIISHNEADSHYLDFSCSIEEMKNLSTEIKTDLKNNDYSAASNKLAAILQIISDLEKIRPEKDKLIILNQMGHGFFTDYINMYSYRSQLNEYYPHHGENNVFHLSELIARVKKTITLYLNPERITNKESSNYFQIIYELIDCSCHAFKFIKSIWFVPVKYNNKPVAKLFDLDIVKNTGYPP